MISLFKAAVEAPFLLEGRIWLGVWWSPVCERLVRRWLLELEWWC